MTNGKWAFKQTGLLCSTAIRWCLAVCGGPPEGHKFLHSAVLGSFSLRVC